MNVSFPDDYFYFKGNKATYDFVVLEGKKLCKDKKIFFCGIIRNGEESLERNILRCRQTAKCFDDFKIFIYENDSTDKTKDILNSYKNEKLNFVSETRQDKDYIDKVETKEDPFHYHRCCVLADCRNKYVDYILENKINEEYDYICVIDFDIAGGWSYEGFYHSIYLLESQENIAATTAYGVVADPSQSLDLEDVNHKKYWMYDTFAFRPINLKHRIHKNFTAKFNMINFNRGEDAIEVQSNFNGLGIYKSKYFKHKYKAQQWEHGFVDPDHVHFHENIRKDGGRILLNPSLLVSYSKHKYCKT